MNRTLHAVTIAYYLLLIGIIVWSLTEPPVEPRLWHHSMTGCRAMARFFGTMGMAAENRYFDAVEKGRL